MSHVHPVNLPVSQLHEFTECSFADLPKSVAYYGSVRFITTRLLSGLCQILLDRHCRPIILREVLIVK